MPHSTLTQTFGRRSEDANLTPMATYLLRLMHLKRTNLCVSADVTTTNELLRLAEDVGDHICVLKTHADIVSDFGEKTIRGLNEIARRKQFVVFEDRKFGDIGNTVQLQYTHGPLQIVRWAAIVNCHIFPGPQIITALAQAAQRAITAYNTSVHTDISASPAGSVVGAEDSEAEEEEEEVDGTLEDDDDDVPSIAESDDLDDYRKSRKQSVVSISTTISTKTETISPQPNLRASLSRHASTDEEIDEDEEERQTALQDLGPPPFYRSLLLLAQMSSADNFFTEPYTAACLQHARLNKNFVMGFIAQRALNENPDDNFITMTPGVQKAAGGDGMGQQYNTPRKVIFEGGTDIIIVGRGVLNAPDRAKEAAEYRKQGWLAYEQRLGRQTRK
ncbi:hypothetical protein AMS68_001784 [Peltaster fructicola]|uniref:Orotidine 5'-phosphate decarboxylase n=1 Tax=Peltaster fructicola TaxID=286661 RepID=A0A6H0XND7_9PEZI|nr:hypothetical protein AMS68_001784 [Peltaster fructicola]